MPLQVILFEIDCAIFYTNLHELFCQFISWTNLVNSGKFMDNCWISCQVMADMKKVYDDLIIINLYSFQSYNLNTNLHCRQQLSMESFLEERGGGGGVMNEGHGMVSGSSLSYISTWIMGISRDPVNVAWPISLWDLHSLAGPFFLEFHHMSQAFCPYLWLLCSCIQFAKVRGLEQK